MRNRDVTFSIITPVYNRRDTIKRCVESVIMQTYPKKNYEHIIVDDASTDATVELVKRLCVNHEARQPIRLVELKEHSERAISRNKGMMEARHDWICWLDSDDAYTQRYLETVARAIKANPGVLCFNFGSIVHHANDHHSIRPTFFPKVVTKIDAGSGCHEEFRSGKIGTGSFVFHKSILKDLGMLPEVKSPYALRDKAIEEFGSRWNDNKDIFDLYLDKGLSLGNPWGDDFYMFYKITRMYISKPLDINLYYHNVR